MEQVAGGDLAMRLSMQEYRSGRDAIAVPRMQLRQDRSGRVVFDGQVKAQGTIPGGFVSGLEVPIKGTYDARSGLALGQGCTTLRYKQLTLYELSLSGNALKLCPTAGRSLLTMNDKARFGARLEGVALNGAISGSPTQVNAESAKIAFPGGFAIEELRAVIRPEDSAVRLSAQTMQGDFSDAIGGSFEGGEAKLDLVALDIGQLSGNWAYEGNILTISEGAFTLTERTGSSPELAERERFEPLMAKDAKLTLDGGAIRANAGLRHPATSTLIANIAVFHQLSDGLGRADIKVPELRFSDSLQPNDLTYLTTGVIAAAEGSVQGAGEVHWNGEAITSSGRFRTDGFDFAAAFGPVKGIAGEIVFTDLINLTTAPDQVIEIASVNPGVEALGGRVVYSMTGGEVIAVKDGRWPFMGGELILRPTEISYGNSGGQNYVFELVGLDAATFVTQMEMTNFGASGTFDGTIPIYFDPEGNGFIRSGLLIARPPGGNVAYIGELTYEDMGAIANYAFQSLRSLDYRQMSVELNGSLSGEIITRFQIDGVRQGEGTSRNFITRRLAKLPIRFQINVRSDNFFTLAKIVRGMFDPGVFADEFDRELLGVEAIERTSIPPDEPENPNPSANPSDSAVRPDEPAVQPPESEDNP